MTDIAQKIAKAEDWSDISDILSDVTEENIEELKPFIPELILNKCWIIRCDVLDIIGDYRLSEFTYLVKKSLHDRIINVRNYALMAYYDLLGKKALQMISKFSKEKNVKLKIGALALYYVETKDKQVFRQIRKIVTRKNCIYNHQFKVKNVFEYYLDTEQFPEIIELYKDILKSVPPSWGIVKDIRKRLKKIRTSSQK